MRADSPAVFVAQPGDILNGVGFPASDEVFTIRGATLCVDDGIPATKLS